MIRRVRSASLTGYLELARSLGLDPDRLLAAVGLSPSALADPDRWIPGPPAARLLDLSASLSGCEDFALLLSEYRRFSTLGPLSLVLSQEPDLRSALDLLARYEDVYTGVVDLRLLESPDLAALQIWMDFDEPVPLRQAAEYTVAAALGVVRALVGSNWLPESTQFSHGPPGDPATHRRIFGPRVRFGADFTGLVLSAGDLDRAIVSADPAVRPYTRRFLESVTPPRPRTPADEVGELVEVLLPSGRATTDEVSRLLGVTPRTLHRQLAHRGESFSAMVHAARARMAERYLADERYSLTDVSGLLGFEAPSAFSRWFRQRFGMTPTQWRRSSRSRK